MTHKLHAFVPPFTLFLNAENAPNPALKHFEMTNNTGLTVFCFLTKLIVCDSVLSHCSCLMLQQQTPMHPQLLMWQNELRVQQTWFLMKTLVRKCDKL